MNKVRYVEQKKPPAVAAFEDIQKVMDAMLRRSWAGVAKEQIVKKSAAAFKSERSTEGGKK